MKKWFLVMIALPLLGCVNPALVELNNGTFCSSDNVRTYAKKHHVTYEEAFEALRRESDSMWAEQDANRLSRAQPEPTVVSEVPARAATP